MPADATTPVAVSPAAEIERWSLALKAAAEVGLDLARALRDEVVSRTEGPFRGVDPSLAYSRITRAMRLSIALEARLREGGLKGAEAAIEGTAENDPVETDAAAETEPGERPERESLHETVREDLAEAALLRRPPAEIYAVICRDLGLTPDPGLIPPDNDNSGSAGFQPATRARGPRSRQGHPGRAALLLTAAAAPMATDAAPFPALRHRPP